MTCLFRGHIVFERSEYWPRDRSSEIALVLESTEGNAPSAEDTLKMHGGKGQKGRRAESLSDHGWSLKEKARIAAGCCNSCQQTNRAKQDVSQTRTGCAWGMGRRVASRPCDVRRIAEPLSDQSSIETPVSIELGRLKSALPTR